MTGRYEQDRYDAWGHDTWHDPPGEPPDNVHRGAVLAQSPVVCGKCLRSARVGVETLVLLDGELAHAECPESS